MTTTTMSTFCKSAKLSYEDALMIIDRNSAQTRNSIYGNMANLGQKVLQNKYVEDDDFLPFRSHSSDRSAQRLDTGSQQQQALVKDSNLADDRPSTDTWNEQSKVHHVDNTLSDLELLYPTDVSLYPPDQRPYKTLTGFTFCTILENCTVFDDVDLQTLKIGRPNVQHRQDFDMAAHIDQVAQQLVAQERWNSNFQRFSRFTADWGDDMLKRGLCFQAAQGNGASHPTLDQMQWLPYAGSRIIRTLDPSYTYPFLHFASSPHLYNPTKHFYSIAYFLLIHENYPNVRNLLDALYDSSVFIYVHIDQEASLEFKRQVKGIHPTSLKYQDYANRVQRAMGACKHGLGSTSGIF